MVVDRWLGRGYVIFHVSAFDVKGMGSVDALIRIFVERKIAPDKLQSDRQSIPLMIVPSRPPLPDVAGP